MLSDEVEENSELDVCRKILDKTICGQSGCIEEVRLLEDIYQMNASQAFERYNAIQLGLPGMRLDLFYPDYDKMTMENDNGIQKEKEATSSEQS